MNRYELLAAAVGIALVAGCASTDRQAASADGKAAASEDDKTYITGSRIPVRDGRGHRDVKATTDRQEIDMMFRPGGNATGGVTGAGGN